MSSIPSECSWITASATFESLCPLFEDIFGKHHKLLLSINPSLRRIGEASVERTEKSVIHAALKSEASLLGHCRHLVSIPGLPKAETSIGDFKKKKKSKLVN